MKSLASLIKWIRTANVAFATLTMMAIITVAVWMSLFGGPGEAVAQETGVPKAVEEQYEKGEVPASAVGLGFLAAAICTCVSALAAGIAVSIVGSAAMGAVSERPELMGRSIIFVGLAEGIAIYGLIVSIMILGKL